MNIVKSGKFFTLQNKFWELQICNNFETAWFKFNISITRKTDHAGFYFELELYHIFINFMIYDSRHWDYENNDYIQN